MNTNLEFINQRRDASIIDLTVKHKSLDHSLKRLPSYPCIFCVLKTILSFSKHSLFNVTSNIENLCNYDSLRIMYRILSRPSFATSKLKFYLNQFFLLKPSNVTFRFCLNSCVVECLVVAGYQSSLVIKTKLHLVTFPICFRQFDFA